MTPTSDKAAPVVELTREMRIAQAEKEAMLAERRAPKPVPSPQGVWEGTLRDLNTREIKKPERIADLGTVPIAEAAKVVLYGQPSSTKTLLAFHAAINVALNGGTVWILEGEGHEWYFRNRLNRIARGLRAEGLGDAQDLIRISHKPFVLEEGEQYWRNRLELWRPKLVLLDPLIDFTAANENDAKEMRAYLRLVQIATDQFGAAAIVCHHSTKPSESGRTRERGSGSIKGWADVHIAVAADDSKREPGRVFATTHCEKGRDLSTRPTDVELRWSFFDERIELEVVELEDAEGSEAPASARPSTPSTPTQQTDRRRAEALARRTSKLIAMLAKGPLSRREIKDRTGWGGAQLKEVLEPLFLEERVHIAQAVLRNARGQERYVDVVKLGSAPPSGAVLSGDPERGSSERGSSSETEATDGEQT